MKKLITFVFCLALAVIVQAQERSKVNQTDMQTRSLLAHDKATFRVFLRVRSRFAVQAQEEDNKHDKRCSAVKIDSNWLIASLTCRGTSSSAQAMDHNGADYTKKVAYRQIDFIKIAGIQVMPEDFFVDESSKVILIRVNDNELAEKLAAKGNVIANLLVAKHPESLVETIGDAYINRENYCLPGRCSAEVDIKKYCTENKCYKVGWKFINGDAGDPLFILSDKYGKAEFLAGLNVAEVVGSSPESGRFYKVFDDNTLQFIETVIKNEDPQAWNRIQKHIVDDTTF